MTAIDLWASGVAPDAECYRCGHRRDRHDHRKIHACSICEYTKGQTCGAFISDPTPRWTAEAEEAWLTWDDTSAKPYRDMARYGFIAGYLAAKGDQ